MPLVAGSGSVLKDTLSLGLRFPFAIHRLAGIGCCHLNGAILRRTRELGPARPRMENEKSSILI